MERWESNSDIAKGSKLEIAISLSDGGGAWTAILGIMSEHVLTQFYLHNLLIIKKIQEKNGNSVRNTYLSI